MIRANSLVKRFQQRVAVNDVSLNIGKGNIFGLLGPNAAGKTTVIRMMCGILRNDEGEIRIDGEVIDRAKSKFGYVAQYFGQYEELSVWENLKFYASMYEVNRSQILEDLLDRYSLTKFKKEKAGALSGGYQRRLALACALAHDPKVLFLDEPTAGIDPVTRKLLWDDFYRLSAQGKTLFVTTHYMEEAQRCHHLAFMASGRIIARGTPETIVDALGDVRIYIGLIAYLPELHQALNQREDILLLNQFGGELRIICKPDAELAAIQAIVDQFSDSKVELRLGKSNLEDVFIALTQEQAAC